MAKVLFISLNDINATGIRLMSAILKREGHESHILFLQRNGFPATKTKMYVKPSKVVNSESWVGTNKYGKKFSFATGPELIEYEKNTLINLVKKISPDLIGISVTSPNKKRAIEVSYILKKNYPSITLIWGGPHPTINPKESLNYCDFVCIGECEKTIVDIAKNIDIKKELNSINNLCYLKNDDLIRNPLNRLIDNLDELPFKDISSENKYMIEKDTLISDFKEFSYSKKYHTITARGCPFNCSYCCEDFLKKQYPGERFLRRRSPLNVIMELKKAKEILDFKEIQFEDDVFSLDINWLKEFKEYYIKEINFPFFCFIFPLKGLNNQLKILKETGLTSTCLALQSGSERINKDIFFRAFNKEVYIEVARMLKKLNINFYVDVITYNPAEKEKDLRDTLDVLSNLPVPYYLNVNHLYSLEGTKIKDALNIYKAEDRLSDKLFDYYSLLFYLTTTYVGHKILCLVKKNKIFKKNPFLITYVSLFAYFPIFVSEIIYKNFFVRPLKFFRNLSLAVGKIKI